MYVKIFFRPLFFKLGTNLMFQLEYLFSFQRLIFKFFFLEDISTILWSISKIRPQSISIKGSIQNKPSLCSVLKKVVWKNSKKRDHQQISFVFIPHGAWEIESISKIEHFHFWTIIQKQKWFEYFHLLLQEFHEKEINNEFFSTNLLLLLLTVSIIQKLTIWLIQDNFHIYFKNPNKGYPI